MATHRTRPRVSLGQLTRSEGIAGSELQACRVWWPTGKEVGWRRRGEQEERGNAGLVFTPGTRQPHSRTGDDSCLHPSLRPREMTALVLKSSQPSSIVNKRVSANARGRQGSSTRIGRIWALLLRLARTLTLLDPCPYCTYLAQGPQQLPTSPWPGQPPCSNPVLRNRYLCPFIHTRPDKLYDIPFHSSPSPMLLSRWKNPDKITSGPLPAPRLCANICRFYLASTTSGLMQQGSR